MKKIEYSHGSSTKPLGNLPGQGEANSNFERDLYNCTFPTLIGEQRKLNQIHP